MFSLILSMYGEILLLAEARALSATFRLIRNVTRQLGHS
jgi:hypothetical protein